jgi:lysine-specific demethylase 8
VVIVRDASPEIVIDRVPAPSPAEFEERYRRASQPAIFTDVVPRWKAWGRWSRDYFRVTWGQHQVLVVPTRGRYVQHDAREGHLRFREMPMAEALERLDDGGENGVYLIVPLDQYLPGLLGEVEVPAYCKDRPGFRGRLWMNAPDIGVPLHRDFSENLIGQLDGVKQFVLYPPEEAHRLYAFPRRSPVPTFCQVDGEAPDPVRFPRCADARRAVVTLRAGEMLFLPSRWWHQVRSVEPSLSINFWWAAGVYERIIRVARRLGLTASV